VEFLTRTQVSALDAAIRSGAVTVEHGYVVRASEIVPTGGWVSAAEDLGVMNARSVDWRCPRGNKRSLSCWRF
jgi:hypothetical protein